ncbi:hypothetical protein KGM_210719 [Danaus plexippus plexippus]|uniref:Uncharacterized protein n=1 Tax=Danaus plexippus plexippus TaxID=278856 RepID=A0A212F164_DANPL|nr:hypothetical protein KGM_210719 [Danaus plexippus plexippus]
MAPKQGPRYCGIQYGRGTLAPVQIFVTIATMSPRHHPSGHKRFVNRVTLVITLM